MSTVENSSVPVPNHLALADLKLRLEARRRHERPIEFVAAWARAYCLGSRLARKLTKSVVALRDSFAAAVEAKDWLAEEVAVENGLEALKAPYLAAEEQRLLSSRLLDAVCDLAAVEDGLLWLGLPETAGVQGCSKAAAVTGLAVLDEAGAFVLLMPTLLSFEELMDGLPVDEELMGAAHLQANLLLELEGQFRQAEEACKKGL